MTHRELKKKYDQVNAQYETMLKLLIAIARQQGGVRVEKRFVEDQQHGWIIETMPSANGESVEIAAKQKSTPALVLQ